MSLIDTLPTRSNRNTNSLRAASRVRFRAGSMRLEMLRSIYQQPNFWTCERFDIRKGWLHQSTSAQLNSLWRAGLVERDDNHVTQTRQGMDEYIYELPDWLRARWDGSTRNLEFVIAKNIHRLNLK